MGVELGGALAVLVLCNANAMLVLCKCYAKELPRSSWRQKLVATVSFRPQASPALAS